MTYKSCNVINLCKTCGYPAQDANFINGACSRCYQLAQQAPNGKSKPVVSSFIPMSDEKIWGVDTPKP